MNGKKPTESITHWLDPGVGRDMPDLYVVGFQEIVDLNAAAVVSDSGTKERSALWIDLIKNTLNELSGAREGFESSYRFLQERHLVGLMLCVFVQTQLIPFVDERRVLTTTASTGIMGIVGNKGGVSLRLTVYNTDLCFVCAHLAAHRDNVEGRNSDFHSIVSKTVFKDEFANGDRLSTEEKLSWPSQKDDMLTNFGIKDHDFVFWLGDFNYRMHTDHTVDEVFKHVEMKDQAWLLKMDQLNIERRNRRAFDGFTEASINFAPTYKYQGGTMNYDRRPEKKLRGKFIKVQYNAFVCLRFFFVWK